MSDARIDGERLWDRLMAMAEVGSTPAGGSNRQALSDDDRAGRQLFMSWAEAAGCTVRFDAIGNLFATRPGRDAECPPVLVGSHLDTQPTGGRFDGVYGVLGGLEVVETLNDAGVETAAPVEIVVWTNEEGSRFQRSMMGSGVWAGVFDLDDTLALADVDGVTVGEELRRHGWAGDTPARPRPYTAAFELHIEQGPILEDAGVEIGVVTGVQGFRWYTIELRGEPAHAGPTPMDARRDPARAIAEIVSEVYAAVAAEAPWGRGTFAQFSSRPVSPNTVPERLSCSLDLRHPSVEVLDRMERAVRRAVAAAGERNGVATTIRCDNDSPPVVFAPTCVAAVQAAADALGCSNMELVSGAGHDSCYVAAHVPASMVFVPCAGGLSHNEAESITPDQAARGADVLLGAVLAVAG